MQICIIRITIALIFVISFPTQAQRAKVQKISIDKSRSYHIPEEDKVYNTLSENPIDNDTVRASLIVEGDTSRIFFTKSVIENDTLKIVIYRTNASVHDEYCIIVFRDQYLIEYKYITTGVQKARKITPIETNLTIESLDMGKGKVIRGYTYLKAKCTGDCWKKWIVVRGNFKVILN